jgi:hypothetical protein
LVDLSQVNHEGDQKHGGPYGINCRSDQAAALLRQAIERAGSSEFIFPGERGASSEKRAALELWADALDCIVQGKRAYIED